WEYEEDKIKKDEKKDEEKVKKEEDNSAGNETQRMLETGKPRKTFMWHQRGRWKSRGASRKGQWPLDQLRGPIKVDIPEGLLIKAHQPTTKPNLWRSKRLKLQARQTKDDGGKKKKKDNSGGSSDEFDGSQDSRKSFGIFLIIFGLFVMFTGSSLMSGMQLRHWIPAFYGLVSLYIYCYCAIWILLFLLIGGFSWDDGVLLQLKDTEQWEFRKAIRRYNPEDFPSSIDHIQMNLECCGRDGPDDWNLCKDCFGDKGVPDSCCHGAASQGFFFKKYKGCGINARSEVR
ncbi:unnamed protein product, partial [Cyprideis torosa]